MTWVQQAILFELFITVKQLQSSREKEALNLFGENQDACGQEHRKSWGSHRAVPDQSGAVSAVTGGAYTA